MLIDIFNFRNFYSFSIFFN